VGREGGSTAKRKRAPKWEVRGNYSPKRERSFVLLHLTLPSVRNSTHAHMHAHSRSPGPRLLIDILSSRKSATAKASPAGSPKSPASLFSVSRESIVLFFLLNQRVLGGEHGAEGLLYNGVEDEPPLSFEAWIKLWPERSDSNPLVWQRSSLSLLANSLLGLPTLLHTSAHTACLSREYTTLRSLRLEEEEGMGCFFPDNKEGAGKRFWTWDEWLWAECAYMTRSTPTETLFENSNTGKNVDITSSNASSSPSSIPKTKQFCSVEFGERIFVPVFDSLHHSLNAPSSVSIVQANDDLTAAQITNPTSANPIGTTSSTNSTEVSEVANTAGGIATHKRKNTDLVITLARKMKKTFLLLHSYGNSLNNSVLLTRYGFNFFGNIQDECSAIGVRKEDFHGVEWDGERLNILNKALWLTGGREANSNFLSLFTAGSQPMLRLLPTPPKEDAQIPPLLFCTAVVAALTKEDLKRGQLQSVTQKLENGGVELSSFVDNIVKSIKSVLARSLTTLLENIDANFARHYSTTCGTTKETWNNFVEIMKGWDTLVTEEKACVAMGPESCIAALYDGQLQLLFQLLESKGMNGEQIERHLRVGKGFCGGARNEFLGTVRGGGGIKEVSRTELGEEDATAVKKSEKGKGEGVKAGGKRNGNGNGNWNQSRNNKNNNNNNNNNNRNPSTHPSRGRSCSRSRSNPRDRPPNHNNHSNCNNHHDNFHNNHNPGPSRQNYPPESLKLHLGNVCPSTTAGSVRARFAAIFGHNNIGDVYIPKEIAKGGKKGNGNRGEWFGDKDSVAYSLLPRPSPRLI